MGGVKGACGSASAAYPLPAGAYAVDAADLAGGSVLGSAAPSPLTLTVQPAATAVAAAAP